MIFALGKWAMGMDGLLFPEEKRRISKYGKRCIPGIESNISQTVDGMG